MLRAVQALLDAAHDSWEPMREAAFSVLLALPRPLPGIATEAALQRLLATAAAGLRSARQHDAEAAARLLALVNRVYVAELGWAVHPRAASRNRAAPGAQSAADTGSDAPALQLQLAPPLQDMNNDGDAAALQRRLQFLGALLEHVEAALASAAQDEVAACRRGFLQGPLLALRRLCDDMPWAAAQQDTQLVCDR